MLWICLAAGLTILLAALSLWGTVLEQQDFGTGRPALDTLVSYTGRGSREEFARLLGEPDEEDRFSLSPEQLAQLPIAGWKRLDCSATDAACIALAALSPLLWTWQARPWAIAVVALAGTVQLLGWVIATVIVLRSGMLQD